MTPTWQLVIPSPIDPLLLTASGGALTGVYFTPFAIAPDWVAADAAATDDPSVRVLHTARAQLAEYFAGTRQVFDLPLTARGTAFQEGVWQALDGIPYGTVISYAELARRVGRPRAVRAVGGANGRNPLSIVRPCHRVIGANGTLTGFGGGLARKEWLLAHEGVAR
jgi:methylated-DNA-[protein]-cysteine S-methyltransferase